MTMENHHRTMEWHYDVTMESTIMTSEVIITSHEYSIIINYSVVRCIHTL